MWNFRLGMAGRRVELEAGRVSGCETGNSGRGWYGVRRCETQSVPGHGVSIGRMKRGVPELVICMRRNPAVACRCFRNCRKQKTEQKRKTS